MRDERRIALADRLICKKFLHCMDVMNHHKQSLRPYDRELFQKLSDGYNLVGDSLTITRKQWNHVVVLVSELEQSKYG